MVCMSCGREHPDDANFCLKCGKSVRTTVQNASSEPPKWEICEIVWTEVKNKDFPTIGGYKFWAKATGPKDSYNAGESEVYMGFMAPANITGPSFADYLRKQKPTLEHLLSQLMNDGWVVVDTPIEFSSNWWGYKLRRQWTADKQRASETQVQAKRVNRVNDEQLSRAMELLSYIRSYRKVRVELNPSTNMADVSGTKIGPETAATIRQLKSYLIKILKQEQGLG